jgi:ABC-type proline/glycine betaine transport system ATPase subunit
MEIAIIKNGAIIQIGEYKTIFPNTSFPSTGPNDEFFLENSAKKVSRFKSYDRAIEKLVSVEPYEEGEFVYVVEVQLLTEEEKV